MTTFIDSQSCTTHAPGRCRTLELIEATDGVIVRGIGPSQHSRDTVREVCETLGRDYLIAEKRTDYPTGYAAGGAWSVDSAVTIKGHLNGQPITSVLACRSQWDATATNKLGQLGACRTVWPTDEEIATETERLIAGGTPRKYGN